MPGSCCAAKAAPVEKSLAIKIALYKPLIVILAVSVSAAGALSLGQNVPFMHGLMAVFLCFLATLKLMNWQGFAKAFAQYDPLARHFEGYAWAYPLIELGLACLYLSGSCLTLANVLMVIVMTIGSLGVLRVLRSGTTVQCACVDSMFSLPVGRVTLAENVVMAGMAVLGLLHSWH